MSVFVCSSLFKLKHNKPNRIIRLCSYTIFEKRFCVTKNSCLLYFLKQTQDKTTRIQNICLHEKLHDHGRIYRKYMYVFVIVIKLR